MEPRPTQPKTDDSFQPGFRLSVIDVAVVVAGLVAAAALWQSLTWIGFIIAFVVAHFFLFCNVFRLARPLELVWSGFFVVLTTCTVLFGVPPWQVAVVLSLCTTVAVVAIEMRKPSYHGVFWQHVNPELPRWWEQQGRVEESPTFRRNTM